MMPIKEWPVCDKKYANNLATINHKYIPPEDENQPKVNIKLEENPVDFVKIMNPNGKAFPPLQEHDWSHDVTILSVDGSLSACHAAVLAASSPFFADLLEDPCRKDNSVLIVAQNADDGQIKKILQFLYTGEIRTDKEEVNYIKELMEEFQIVFNVDVIDTDLENNDGSNKVNTEDILEKADMIIEGDIEDHRDYNFNGNDKDYLPTKTKKKAKKIKQNIGKTSIIPGRLKNEGIIEVNTLDTKVMTEANLENSGMLEEINAVKNIGYNVRENDQENIVIKVEPNMRTSKKLGRPRKPKNLKRKKKTTSVTVKKVKIACDYCELKNRNLKDTMKHVQKYHPEFSDTFAKIHLQTLCQYCDQKFLDKAHLYTHKKERHPETLPTGQRLRYNINDGLPHLAKRQCPHCAKVLTSLRYYKDHIQKHLTGKNQPFECQKCEKKFCKSNTLRLHRKKHEISETPFLCNLCGSTFKTEFDYEQHNRTHTLEIPRKKKIAKQRSFDPNFSAICNVCGKGFAKEKIYTYHIKYSHVEEDKLLKCDQCPQTFSLLRSFETHIKLHLPPTMDCNHCAKKFHTPQYLKRHMKSQHVDDREKDFVCNKCGKGFSKKDNYEGHLNMHAGLKPFKCRYCQMCYQNSSNRIAHEKSRHPDTYIRRATKNN